MPKTLLGVDVLTAAQERISWAFDKFERIYLSFSAGKDSTVMMHLVMDEAMRRKQKIGVFFLDWECQFSMTVKQAKRKFDESAEWFDPYWVSVPITTWNGCSQHEPEWVAWDDDKQWVREKESIAIKDGSYFDFYVTI